MYTLRGQDGQLVRRCCVAQAAPSAIRDDLEAWGEAGNVSIIMADLHC